MTVTTRRAILAGLAATPIAGLPALANALPGADPVLAALAEYRRARESLDENFARADVCSDKLDALLRERGLVTFFRGEEVRSLPLLEYRLGQMANVTPEIEAEYQAARAVFIEREPDYRAAYKGSDLEEVEHARDDLSFDLYDAEDAMLQVRPTTREGALRLLVHVAERLASETLGDREAELAPDAIRAAVAVLQVESFQ